MRIESSGHSRGNPRLFELVEHAPKAGKSPTVWAWPELMDYLKIAGQPVARNAAIPLDSFMTATYQPDGPARYGSYALDQE